MRILTVILAIVAVGCDGDPKEDELVPCVGAFGTGELVISEFLANPSGADEGLEWVEIHNASENVVELEGVRIEFSKSDLEGVKSFQLPAFQAESESYTVLGDVATEFAPAHIDIGYGFELGSMKNSDGRIALYCDDRLVDEVIYSSVPDGKSEAFNGQQVPDAEQNDVEELWCVGEGDYDATDNEGTPGAENNTCPLVLPGKCNDPLGNSRDIIHATAGDLVITEVMPNPAAVSDSAGEWFEIKAISTVDLNEMKLGTEAAAPKQTLLLEDCVSVSPGEYVVVARNDLSEENGGLGSVVAKFSFSLTNSNGSLSLIDHEGNEIDSVTWASSSSGKSRSLDASAQNAADNDDENNWCNSENPWVHPDPLLTTDSGTPAAANEVCEIPLPAGQCLDGGIMRPIVPPALNELTVTELMANPDGTDGGFEWFELRAEATFDLNELGFGRDGTTMTQEETLTVGNDCKRVNSGDYILFAQGADTATNGGLPVVDGTFTSALRNTSGERNIIIFSAGAVVASYDYGVSGSATSGNSWSFDDTIWCSNSTDFYGAAANSNYGTPKQINPTCP